MRSSASAPCSALRYRDLLLADAVLAGAGAAHGDRAQRQPLAERFAPSISSRELMSISGETWKLPSPTWPTIGAMRPSSAMSRLRLLDAIGQPRNRHADVGGEASRARPQGRARPIGVVARLPELVRSSGLVVQAKGAAVGRGDLGEAARLFRDAASEP